MIGVRKEVYYSWGLLTHSFLSNGHRIKTKQATFAICLILTSHSEPNSF